MTAADVALALASLGHAGPVPAEHLLHEMTALAARLLPGCCGASVTVWDGGRILRSSMSHLDLAALRELPRSPAEDPERHAAAAGETVMIADTLAPAGWRAFCTAAAAFGIRSVAVAPAGPRAGVTFAFYSTLPHAFDGTDLGLIARQAGVVLWDAEYYGDLAGDVRGLRASAESRSIVDQAIGILIAERRCSAQDALAELHRLSQTQNTKLADVAKNMVSERSPG